MHNGNTKHARTISTNLAPVIAFHFKFVDVVSSTDIQTQTERLKVHLRERQPKWRGQVLLRRGYINMDIIIYDVKTQTTSKILRNQSIRLNKLLTIGEELFVFNYESANVYKLDVTNLIFSLVYKSPYAIYCLTPLQYNAIAIGTQEGIIIVDENWKIITLLEKKNVIDFIQLKDGRFVSLHSTRQYRDKEILFWNENKIETTIKTMDCSTITELSHGYVCGTDRATTSIMIDIYSHEISSKGRYCHVLQLANGWHVMFASHKFSVFHGAEILYEVSQYDLSKVADAVIEVSPGVIAWQVMSSVMCFDVIKRSPVEDFPKGFWHLESSRENPIWVRHFILE